ncbi:MAG: PEP-utilizing enzyme, partial [Thaumarchaeota archaeon]|nr:PEP-utilizing enzyme [Nitrososphaerota archaeon]
LLVDADSAGVVFTANPATGDHEEIVVNAVRGLGERLVSGEATADHWIVRNNDKIERVRNQENALTNENVLEIGRVARRIEQLFLNPLDIEWAYSKDQLFILQARPITSLPQPVEWKPPHQGTWLRNFRLGEWLGEPVTPLFESWLLYRIEERMYDRLRKVVHAPTPRPFHVIVNGWYFTSANFLPKSRAKAVWLLFRYMIPAFLMNPRGFSTLIPSISHWGMKSFEKEWRESIGPAYTETVTSGWNRIQNSKDALELVSLIDDIANAAGDFLYSLFVIAGSAWKPEYVLASFYQDHLSQRTRGTYQRLLQAVSPSIPRSSGHIDDAVLSLDWSQPTLGELQIQNELIKDDADTTRRGKAVENRLQAESECRRALQHEPRQLEKFERLLYNAQYAAKLREEQVPQLTKGWQLLRSAVRLLGKKLVSLQLTQYEDDIFFLSYNEVINALRENSFSKVEFSNLVRDRRACWEKQRRLTPPLIIGELSWGVKNMLSRYESTLATTKGKTTLEENIILSGQPASPGRVTGKVRIIRNAEGFPSLESGEILVAPATTPAWTMLFSLAAAVVTDSGSLMAHASLVAREYGIPGIVATGNATVVLKDGQIVTVDGTTGLILRAS